jgi:hypothetical protein
VSPGNSGTQETPTSQEAIDEAKEPSRPKSQFVAFPGAVEEGDDGDEGILE